MVHIVEGGEQKRMSKRRGDVVLLDELVDAIGVDAARFYLVQRSHDATIDIDLELAVEQGPKNPVYYVQYAHARIGSMLRRAGAARRCAVPDALAARPSPARRRWCARSPISLACVARPATCARRTASSRTRATSRRTSTASTAAARC